MSTRRCRHCDDELPSDVPPHVISCKGYADWRARLKGDMLPADEADDLTLYGGLGALAVALGDGLPRLPDVP
jgi:hypothetical protein